MSKQRVLKMSKEAALKADKKHHADDVKALDKILAYWGLCKTIRMLRQRALEMDDYRDSSDSLDMIYWSFTVLANGLDSIDPMQG